MPAVSPARKAAFQILMAVERGQSHSDDLLRGKAVNALSAPDRHLATALVLGVLRWQILLDRQLQALLKRPNGKLDPEILIALRLGAFQLLHLDRIPARAAIDESVELAKQAGHKFASGMVNAVLRKLAATTHSQEESVALKGHGLSLEGDKEHDEVVSPIAEKGSISDEESESHPSGAKALGDLTAFAARLKSCPDTKLGQFGAGANSSAAFSAPKGMPAETAAELALAQAHPLWMVERWADVYGLEAARLICRHGQKQPAFTVRIVGADAEAEMREVGIELTPGELLTAARTVVSGDVTATVAFSEGRVRLQDEGSQLVAEIAGLGNGSAGCTILDCCAAPGGKTLILAERNPSARIVACESSAERLAQMRSRLEGHSDRIECRLADATTLKEDGVFDLALADVPCSGTGTLGRNPEIRHRLKVEDLARQAERQRAILTAALRAVREGGRVVYSTCSLEPEENEQLVAAVLAAGAKARLVSIGSSIAGLLGEGILTSSGAERLRDCITPEGALRLLPGVFHTDGFFMAMMERTS